MIYGKEEAAIEDSEYGRVHLTVTHDPVSIKQGGDLIRLQRPAARELAADLLACLNALEKKDRGDPEWTPARRSILRRAIAKAQAGAEQRERIAMDGAEAAAMWKAAEAWEEMMTMLDQAALDGKLQGLSK